MMEKARPYYDETIDNAKVVQEIIPENNKSGLARICETYHLHIIITLISYVMIIAFFAVFMPRYIVEKTQVVGDSMEDALFDGDDIIINKIAYRFKSPSRYDVVVFYPKGVKKGDYLVKRVIGCPGETVQIVNGEILIDGNELEEDYGKNAIVNPGIAAVPITLGEDEYFVLGDNRIISRDSRYDSVGIVKKDYIVGRVWVRIFPMEALGSIH